MYRPIEQGPTRGPERESQTTVGLLAVGLIIAVLAVIAMIVAMNRSSQDSVNVHEYGADSQLSQPVQPLPQPMPQPATQSAPPTVIEVEKPVIQQVPVPVPVQHTVIHEVPVPADNGSSSAPANPDTAPSGSNSSETGNPATTP